MKFTERAVLDALAARYSQASGNGERWVRAEHVRNVTGFGGYDRGTGRTNLRTADLIAVDLWQGNEIHGHEVKVSRSDWLTELRDPTKAEAFKRYCTRWWLVVSDASIVRDGELPAGWGLLALDEDYVARVVRRAPRLEPEVMPREFVASMMRATAKTTRKDVER